MQSRQAAQHYLTRYDKVDVLSLLDPDWFERALACGLPQAGDDQTDYDDTRESQSRSKEPVLAA